MKLLTVRVITERSLWKKKIENNSFRLRTVCSGQTPGNFHRIIENHELGKAYNELSEYIVQELEEQRKDGVTVNLTRVPIDCK